MDDARQEEVARERRRVAALRYKPESVELLLVAEAPPGSLDRYFYFEDVREQDSLFRYVAKAVVPLQPSRSNKAEILGRLKQAGVFLIDLKPDPIVDRDRSDLHEQVAGLVDRSRTLAPRKIILIKANVFELAYPALRRAGLPVVDVKVPFPGSGRQKEFEQRFAMALVAPLAPFSS